MVVRVSVATAVPEILSGVRLLSAARHKKVYHGMRVCACVCWKALAWCPWQPSLLASGGGTADRQIRLWNVNNGACLQSTETNSQVMQLSGSTYSHLAFSALMLSSISL